MIEFESVRDRTLEILIDETVHHYAAAPVDVYAPVATWLKDIGVLPTAVFGDLQFGECG